MADDLAQKLTASLDTLPSGFLDSFSFTKTRNNLTHPIVLDLLARIAPAWELRWTTDGYGNARIRGKRAEVRENPFRFWYSFCENEFGRRDMTNVVLINIDGTRASRAYPPIGHKHD